MLGKYKTFWEPNLEDHIFLSGEDCYALRCAFLHQGSDDISHQRARTVLEKFSFVVRKGTMRILHTSLDKKKLELQVDSFCEDICRAAEKWIGDIALKNNNIITRMSELLVIVAL